MQIIDLSQPIEKNKGEPHDYKLEQISHKEGAIKMGRNIVGKEKVDITGIFPDDEFLNLDVVSISTHTGTHIDAPFHYGSMSEGKAAKTIDEVPLEWFYGNGVVLDMRHKRQGELITANDICKGEARIGHHIVENDIVLINTGAAAYWGTERYFTDYPGLSGDAVQILTDKGVHLIGTDAYGLDRPFSCMIDAYKQNRNSNMLFPAHFYGRKKEYCQIERLANLNSLVTSTGFKVACFPIKITGAGAAWARAVAIYQ